MVRLSEIDFVGAIGGIDAIDCWSFLCLLMYWDESYDYRLDLKLSSAGRPATPIDDYGLSR